MRIILLLSVVVLGLSACDSETRYRVLVPNSHKQAYIDIQLQEGGWKTPTQNIYVSYGYKTGVFTDDYEKRLAIFTVMAPSIFITYDELSTEWRGSTLFIHTKHYGNLSVNVSDSSLQEGVITNFLR